MRVLWVVFQWIIKHIKQDYYKLLNVNSNNPIFYPFSIKISNSGGNCNNVNYPYAKICDPDIIKTLNVKSI